MASVRPRMVKATRNTARLSWKANPRMLVTTAMSIDASNRKLERK